ncbi:MAG: 1-deoxy-D-xylulose-5-phosphate reductoisomerase [Clostridia bacterium]|nr:1-deoxy-D-xylulose-5-phosphate reductoisomerase [Clostridia bacterium]
MRKKISVLGSTGSIGRQTLDIIKANKESMEVYALAVHTNIDGLQKQIYEFKPEITVVSDKTAYKRLKDNGSVSGMTKIIGGASGLIEAASHPDVDIAVIAVSGIAGLHPTMAALSAKKRVALANKETMVIAGSIVMEKAKNEKAEIIPVDSEHSAIFQCLQNGKNNVKRLLLTASGGPFLRLEPEKLNSVTPEMALAHPNWSMGQKISIDSATLMNKGLELIEARWMFDIPYKDIEVLIHPQSIVHSMVEYNDGAVIAQLGLPDMAVPIQYALSWPNRLNYSKELDLTKVSALSFEKPDEKVFPSLRLARDAGEEGGLMPVILNASNEVAVKLFLQDRISFTAIPHLVEEMMGYFENHTDPDLDMILEVDARVRDKTLEYACKNLGKVVL